MANFTYKETKTEKVVIKGMLSDDGKTITVTEKNGDRDVSIQEYINKFSGGYVEMTLGTKSENDLLDDE